MDTNRLSKTISEALNAQMTKEAHSAQIYLAYAVWAADKGYDGISNFLFRHANEERNHMMKVLEYILDRGGKVNITAIPAPGDQPKNVNDCFEKVFKAEVDNTTTIYKLVKLSHDEQDWATWNFMQWFVKEQIEEESLAMKLLDKITIAGGENAKDDALYAIDRELEKMPDEAKSAEEATTANP